jgi:quercetin 2,3-dioxygenase
MGRNRAIRRVFKSKATVEGAGVHLKRAFGFSEVPQLDPFLLMDDFRSEQPSEYLKGFPWHPHRGIETITYVLSGGVEHGDSLGNSGVIGPGDVQWMTAGSGIIHQEMPKGDSRGRMGGIQLWANLPASDKMKDPRYRDVHMGQIPVIKTAGGAEIRIVAGEVDGVKGPVGEIVIDPLYLDVTVPEKRDFEHPTVPGHTVLAYVLEGRGLFGDPPAQLAAGDLGLFEDGDSVPVSAQDAPVRFLLVSGKPIGEPVAWYGPVVMSTQEELRVAFQEYRSGTFIKHGPAGD